VRARMSVSSCTPTLFNRTNESYTLATMYAVHQSATSAPDGAPTARRMSLMICTGRKRPQIGTNHAPAAQPVP
jgi:hypothetical protein